MSHHKIATITPGFVWGKGGMACIITETVDGSTTIKDCFARKTLRLLRKEFLRTVRQDRLNFWGHTPKSAWDSYFLRSQP